MDLDKTYTYTTAEIRYLEQIRQAAENYTQNSRPPTATYDLARFNLLVEALLGYPKIMTGGEEWTKVAPPKVAVTARNAATGFDGSPYDPQKVGDE